MSRRGVAPEQGSALIAVLWLVAALSTVVFATATLVRGEIDITATKLDNTRAYYLAAGAIDRALLRIYWHPERPIESELRFPFPGGSAEVRIFAENKKANINTIQPEALSRVLLTLGASSPEAQAIASFGRFAPGHSPIGDLEELLAFPGVTADLFYGHFISGAGGRMAWRPGIGDVLTVAPLEDVLTLRATAKVNSAQRSVAAVIRLKPGPSEQFFHTLRWYDDAASISPSW